MCQLFIVSETADTKIKKVLPVPSKCLEPRGEKQSHRIQTTGFQNSPKFYCSQYTCQAIPIVPILETWRLSYETWKDLPEKNSSVTPPSLG